MADWRPSATRRALAARAGLSGRVRAWFAAHPALEVETPVLSAAAPTDPHIHGLGTDIRGLGRRWLQSSPEFPMKRLLAAGVGDCWQLCRVFRDGEAGRLHNPEFTLLEWYRVGWDDRRLAGEVDALLRALLAGHRELGPATRVRYADAFAAGTGLALADADAAACARVAASAGIAAPAGLSAPAWHDLLMGALVLPRLGGDGPCFVTDYPVGQAALARLRGAPPHAARFELVLDGVELANGYHELGDAAEQAQRFAADNAARTQAGEPPMPVDQRLLAALDHGLPDCAGVALGFDRVLMLALGASHLSEVLAFPADRA